MFMKFSMTSVQRRHNLVPPSSSRFNKIQYHKAAKSAEKKSGLKVAGVFDCAIQPAPDLNREGAWLCRPLTCSETKMVIRCLLQIDDRDVTFHSLKTTCLSWTAKAELPREQRRLLGGHSSSLQDSDSIYARDLAVAPVKALQRVLTLIRDGEFEPDQPRADFFKGANPLAPGTPAPVF